MSDIHGLLTERGKTHGDFADHARITQCLKHILHTEQRWPRLSVEKREALDMIAHKIGRIIAGDASFPDHWDDIAGYATLVSQRLPKAGA